MATPWPLNREPPRQRWSRSSSGSLAIFAAIRRAFEDEPGDVLPRTLFDRI